MFIEESFTTKDAIEEKLISYTRFEIGCIALFFPRSSDAYIAFHLNCPHRFLAKVLKLNVFH